MPAYCAKGNVEAGFTKNEYSSARQTETRTQDTKRQTICASYIFLALNIVLFSCLEVVSLSGLKLTLLDTKDT